MRSGENMETRAHQRTIRMLANIKLNTSDELPNGATYSAYRG